MSTEVTKSTDTTEKEVKGLKGLKGRKSLTGERKYADIIRWLKERIEDSKLSYEQQSNAVDRLQKIYFHIDTLVSRKESRELKRDLSGIRRCTPEEDAAIKAELEKVTGDENDVDPFF
jgi:hypothetical protein